MAGRGLDSEPGKGDSEFGFVWQNCDLGTGQVWSKRERGEPQMARIKDKTARTNTDYHRLSRNVLADGALFQSFLLIMAQETEFPQSTVCIKFVMQKARQY
jgi:hypothetical protein